MLVGIGSSGYQSFPATSGTDLPQLKPAAGHVVALTRSAVAADGTPSSAVVGR